MASVCQGKALDQRYLSGGWRSHELCGAHRSGFKTRCWCLADRQSGARRRPDVAVTASPSSKIAMFVPGKRFIEVLSIMPPESANLTTNSFLKTLSCRITYLTTKLFLKTLSCRITSVGTTFVVGRAGNAGSFSFSRYSDTTSSWAIYCHAALRRSRSHAYVHSRGCGIPCSEYNGIFIAQFGSTSRVEYATRMRLLDMEQRVEAAQLDTINGMAKTTVNFFSKQRL